MTKKCDKWYFVCWFDQIFL